MAASIAIRLIFFILLFGCVFAFEDDFHEELLVKPMKNGQVYTSFQFTTTWNVSVEDEKSFEHYHLFSKSLGEVLSHYSVQELHLSLTQGLWHYEKWGYPVHDAPPGAELWVWFRPGTENIDQTWTDLINVLSGMFCASLNFLDHRSVVTPHLAFRPTGVTPSHHQRLFAKNIRYATLPNENVCTENMTPWKKLLPCGARAGLTSLLNAYKVYDTSYHSLGVHFRPICMSDDCSVHGVELVQSLAAVFDPTLTSRSQDWSLKKLFARTMSSSCPVASSSIAMVDLSSNFSSPFTLDPLPSREEIALRGRIKVRYAVYEIRDFARNQRVFNLAAKYKNEISFSANEPPVVHAQRFQTGYGQAKGGVMSLLYNHHPKENIIVNYLEVIPWFCRVYLHTLKIESFDKTVHDISANGTIRKPMHFHYVPGKDRQRPYHLELLLDLPPNSVTRLSFEFDRALLKWTEYPPDANHGFYIGSAVISTVVRTAKQYSSPPQSNSRLIAIINDTSESFFLRLHTETLLITLPTPDFSMPYNVICLACTVVAIAFGSIHNLTTRQFVAKDPSKHKGILSKIKEKLFFWKKKEISEEKKEN